jgi:hypothetical protein
MFNGYWKFYNINAAKILPCKKITTLEDQKRSRSFDLLLCDAEDGARGPGDLGFAPTETK